MRENRNRYSRTSLDVVALALLITAEICFYRVGTLTLYFLMTGFGVIVGIFVVGTRYISRKINPQNFPIWLIVVYSIFLLNGFLRLQRGVFPWDTIVYRFVENLAMYFLFRDLVREEKTKIVYPFIMAGIFSLGYFFMVERATLQFGYERLGNKMSGNVNTVGYNFGMISMFAMWWYCKEKKWYKLVLFGLFTVVMLLTGSKKVLVLLLIDFLLLFENDRGHVSRWLKFGLAFAALVFLIFNVPMFYEIIGIRIETMFETMIYGKASALYSYSTDVRNDMLKEGFSLFLKTPVFGGGYNNFYAHTVFGFDYSHNNYIELLCSFGIFGTLIYYSKHLKNLTFLLKGIIKKRVKDKAFMFAIALSIAVIVMDWVAVSFSAVCVWYIPLIVASVLVEDFRFGYSNNDMEISKKE